MAQALGFALYEDTTFDQEGHVINARFGPYRVLKEDEMPVMDVIFVQIEEPSRPFSAKPVAEISIDWVAPALVSAIHDAVGGVGESPSCQCRLYLDRDDKTRFPLRKPTLHQE